MAPGSTAFGKMTKLISTDDAFIMMVIVILVILKMIISMEQVSIIGQMDPNLKGSLIRIKKEKEYIVKKMKMEFKIIYDIFILNIFRPFIFLN